MDFGKSDIQSMLVESAGRLLGRQAGVEYWREQRRGQLGFEQARWRAFADLGWLALLLPEAAGGMDGSMEDATLLNIELGRALATEPYVSTAVLGAHIVARGFDADRAAPLLAAIAEGGLLLALAHQEDGHNPLATTAAATVARRQADAFVLSGRKMLAADAPSADKLIVSASIAGEDGTALFLIDRETPGMMLESYPLVDGTRAADVTFQDVVLPAEALIRGGNGGAELLAEALDRAGIAMLAQAVGSMESCLRICGDYARERRQFGQPIGAFQAIQHMLADMFVSAYQARSMLYYAVANGYGGAEARAAALSAAKIVIGEAAQLVSRNGIQVHGGYGLTDEYPISHHYRRLMTIEKFHGDIHRHTKRFGDTAFA